MFNDDAAFVKDCDAVWHSDAMKALRVTYGFTAWCLPQQLPHSDPSPIYPLTTLVKFSKNCVWIKRLIKTIYKVIKYG